MMPHPKRILHIVPSVNPVTGGPAMTSLAIGKSMADAGCDVTIFSTNWPAAQAAWSHPFGDETCNRVKVEIFPAPEASKVLPLPYSPALVRAVGRRSAEFETVICHSLWNPVASFSMRALRRANTAYVLMPHGTLDPLVLGRRHRMKSLCALVWERANVEKASALIFNSALEESKARSCGWRLPRTWLFPHVVDLAYWIDLPSRSDFEDRFPKTRGREVVLFVGRIDWVKNLDVLLEAIPHVRKERPAAMLVCVGPDNNRYRQQLESLALSLGLQEHVLFTGMLLGKRLKAAFARGDAFALVSKKENFGLAAAEALACGLPVVLSEGVDMGKHWPAGGPVRRVQPFPEAIASALIDLLERSSRCGLPDIEARSLAQNDFGNPKPFPLTCIP